MSETQPSTEPSGRQGLAALDSSRPAEDPYGSNAPASRAAFRSILPEDIEWKPFRAFPGVRLAAVVGQPSEPAR
jgi:hypothetical protein